MKEIDTLKKFNDDANPKQGGAFLAQQVD